MREIETARILAIGSELLTPNRTDTNSLFLTAQLNDLGIEVIGKAVVGDDRAAIADAVRRGVATADLLVLTGGLGPTDDDVSREGVADALQLPLAEDPRVMAAIEARFASRGLRMSENNRGQAQVPRGADVIDNPNGSAPGIWVESGGAIVILLPGPPRELQAMVHATVVPRLAVRTAGRRVRRRVLKLTGRAESQVDEIAQPIYAPRLTAAVPIHTSILASPGQIELQVSAAGRDIAALDRALEDLVSELALALVPHVFSIDGRSLEEVVGDQLRARRWHIAVAESCTAGLVLGRLTDVAGSSGWVTGGVVAYADDVKVSAIGVPRDLLVAHGAVSEPVAAAMAAGIRARFGTEIGVGVTGIAGPSGGSDAKPVGTVVIALSGPQAVVRTFRFAGDRRMIRQQSVAAALDMVRRNLE